VRTLLPLLTLSLPALAQDLRAVLPDGTVRAGDPVLGGWADLGAVPGPVGEGVLLDGLLWVGRPDGQVWCVDEAGDATLAFQVPGGAEVLARDGVSLLAVGSDDVVRRVDPLTGQVLEEVAAPDGVVSLFASFAAGRVAGTASGQLWREVAGTYLPFVDLAGQVPVALLEADAHLFVATDQGRLLHLKLDGTTVAEHGLGAPAVGMVEHLTDMLVCIQGGRLLRVDRETGQVLTSTELGSSSGSLTVEQDSPLGWAYCYGDTCACGNEDPKNGCENSTGLGAYLLADGSTSVAADDVKLVLTHMVPGGFYLMLMGQGWNPQVFNDGLLCIDVTQPFFRYPIGQVNGAGFDVMGPGLIEYGQDHFGANGHIRAGDTWHFQTWYRDPHGPCGTGSNLTNAYSVTFGS